MIEGSTDPNRADVDEPRARPAPLWPTVLAFGLAVIALVSLALVPYWTGRRVEAHRGVIESAAEPARTLARELDFAISREDALVRGFLLAGDRSFVALLRRARADEERALAALVPLTRRLDPSADRQLVAVRSLVAEWHAPHDALLAGSMAPADFLAGIADQQRRYESVLAGIARFEDELARVQADRRAAIRSAERLQRRLLAALAAIALAAALGVAWLGWRYRALMGEAERGRRVAENSQRRVGSLMWYNPDAVYELDGESRLLDANPATGRLLGSSVEALRGTPVLQRIVPEDRERVTALFQRALAGEPQYYETAILRQDGERVPVSMTDVPIQVDGHVGGVFGIAEDITARRRAEEERATLLERERDARHEAERRAREEAALREATEAVTATFSIEEVIERVASSALEATGADGAFVERIGDGLREVEVVAIAGAPVPECGSRMPYPGSLTARVIERGEPELLLDARSGAAPLPESLPDVCSGCALMVVPLLNAGEAIGALFLVRGSDRPGFRPDEVARAHTFANLASLAFRKIHLLLDSERKREELEQVVESRAHLIRGFSHDLKNPLGAADGHLALLEDEILGPLAPRQMQSVERSRRAIRSALRLIDDLVELARAEAGQLEIDAHPVDVREVARELVEEYRAQVEGSGLELRCDFPDTFPVIRSDAARVRQVLGNLLSNAVKYTPAGSVDVGVSLRDGRDGNDGAPRVVVEVRDTGAGIPAEKLHLLFTEFTRLHPDAAHGAGLGLAISRRIAHALGGDITVESTEGRGSTFRLWLPGPDGPSGSELHDARTEAEWAEGG
ncbi:MAG TPA: ATP-binding protein [Longimicrobiaceae bacterium]|nr:ATP-binding protein [Longimicrobiaceae bacterium]